jgi:NAD(P)H-dependent flavin oxidoreductase YrpB (nitropropane dioxygenase family)
LGRSSGIVFSPVGTRDDRAAPVPPDLAVERVALDRDAARFADQSANVGLVQFLVRRAAAAFTLGAQAVQLGTAFLACEESGAEGAHRDRLLDHDAFVTMLSRHVTGRLARFVETRLLEELERQQLSPLPYPVQGWFVRPIRAAAIQASRPEYGAFYASQSAPLLRHRNARDLMKALITGLDEITR